MRIAVCASQVPFSHGGAEIHVDSLLRELRERGFETDLIKLPFSDATRPALLRSCVAWRLLDLAPAPGQSEIDLVIATRFPSYLIRHPNKVVWLIHQHRAAYELKDTPYSDLGHRPEDERVVELIRRMDSRMLGEARALFANSNNTAQRLRRFNKLEATALYPPPHLGEQYRCAEFGEYILGVGRLDRLKRFERLVELMARTRTSVRCRIVGDGPERARLQELIAARGLTSRVELLGSVDDSTLLSLYADALAVYYAPFDEDYGYVTIEAFKSAKPVITAKDSGGVLEFAEHGINGYVHAADDIAAAAADVDALHGDRALARRLGLAGLERVGSISWDPVITALTGRSHAED